MRQTGSRVQRSLLLYYMAHSSFCVTKEYTLYSNNNNSRAKSFRTNASLMSFNTRKGNSADDDYMAFLFLFFIIFLPIFTSGVMMGNRLGWFIRWTADCESDAKPTRKMAKKNTSRKKQDNKLRRNPKKPRWSKIRIMHVRNHRKWTTCVDARSHSYSIWWCVNRWRTCWL